MAKHRERSPISTRWIDVNKGDREMPNYRPRLVAKEHKNNDWPDLFAATPPAECLKLLLSHLAPRRRKEKVLYADVSRAYFYARVRRPVYVRIPDEDRRPGEEGMVGRLQMSMYGARDAAQNWAEEYSDALRQQGFTRGTTNACLFYNPRTGIGPMVHGDDFFAVGPPEALKSLENGLESRYKVKVETASEEKCDKQETIGPQLRHQDHGPWSAAGGVPPPR